MNHRRLHLCAIGLASSLALTGGCETLSDYRPLPVLVEDAETGKPLAGAEVRITYPHTQDFRAPDGSRTRTGSDGVARTSAAPFGNPGPVIQVSAPDYMDEEKWLSVETIQALEPAGRSKPAEGRPVAVAVKMFARPEPTVELILPPGFHGRVKAEVKIQDDLAYPPHQRCFSYVVPPSGTVQITGPPLLRRIFGTDFQARYADSPPLAYQPKDSTIGWWWLGHEGDEYRFLVGTEMDYKMRSQADAQEQQRSPASSSQSQGGGRRHRRGGASPSD